MTDQTFFTSDGTNLIYVGSNVNTLYAVTSANIASIVQANSTGIFIGANVSANTTALDVGNTTFTTTNAIFGGTITTNGSIGTAGQVLTSGAGTNAYWSTVGAASVNVAAQYAWTNTHSFAANVSFSNNIGLASAGGIYFNLVADGNWRMGRNTGGVGTKFFYTGNTLDIVAANSSLEGIAFGYTGNTYLETGYNGTYTRNPIYVGNSTQNIVTTNTTLLIQANSTVNSTHTASLVQISNSTSTANLTALDLKIGATTVVNSTQVTATLHVGNVSGSYANITGQVNTATLYAATSANIASAVQANATGVYTTGTMNAASHTVGTAFTANSTVVNAVAYYSGTLLVANSTVSNATHLGGTAAASYVQNTDSRTLSGNLVISGTSFTPSTNTILLGNSTQRWVLSANTGSFSGAVSGITTLAAGNTTITGFANVTSTIQGGSSLTIAGALSGVTTAAMGNTTVTGFANVTTSVNSALFSVGTSFIANTTGAYHTGTVNAASHTVGSTFIANTTQLTTTVPFSANGGTGTTGHVLTSNGATGSPYWASAAGGGYYKGGTSAVGTLAAGGQNIFRVNANTLNTSTTFAAGENGQATGPITVASGITLTIESGARVSIV